MRYNLILNILGLISKYISIMFLIPVIAAYFLNEANQVTPFLSSAIIAMLLGFILSAKKAQQKDIDNIRKSESLTTVFFAWILFALLCAIPYLFYNFNFTDALFESMSGVTTTGATIIDNFTLYPKVLFLFRSLTQWFGYTILTIL